MLTTLKKTIYTIVNPVWKLFLRGLFALLPITLTLALFKISFNLIYGWLQPLKKLNITWFSWLPYPEIFAVIIFIIVVGLILRSFIFRPLLHWVERLLFKIPLVRPVYSGTKQLVKAFNPEDGQGTFKYVVTIEYPRAGIYSLGFIASQLHPDLAPKKDERYFTVFIPSVPNPATGNLILLPESSITITALTRQDAMAMIISGGIIQPDAYKVAAPLMPARKE